MTEQNNLDDEGPVETWIKNQGGRRGIPINYLPTQVLNSMATKSAQTPDDSDFINGFINRMQEHVATQTHVTLAKLRLLPRPKQLQHLPPGQALLPRPTRLPKTR
ncbi:hypothetical protein EDC01DRAFT_628256 [Geopyxis carbonaria]|nr:hypothetical protein EDC01DRAFT_628256 [Geopyxis carbonaria]